MDVRYKKITAILLRDLFANSVFDKNGVPYLRPYADFGQRVTVMNGYILVVNLHTGELLPMANEDRVNPCGLMDEYKLIPK